MASTDPTVDNIAVPDEKVNNHEKVTGEEPQPPAQELFQLTVKLPHEPYSIQIMVSSSEQVQDIRQSVIDLPGTFQYSCFHLEHNGVRINDYVELSDVPGIAPDSELVLVEDPYTEKEARIHFLRTRELIGASGGRIETAGGISAGMTHFDGINTHEPDIMHPFAKYDFEAPASLDYFLRKPSKPLPKCVRGLSLSPWNPPPYHLRQKGHLLYLQVQTLESEYVHFTSHVSGFYVNNSTNQKFDPSPKSKPKVVSAHSLITLLGKISPNFITEFAELQDANSKKDPLITFGPINAIPASPWLVSAPTNNSHTSDFARPQEVYLIAGTETVDSLRDFNEEFQSTRELPRETVQERVFRERLLSKLFADYTEAAVRGAVLIARGEIAPLNPTEGRDAQIYVYNNIFFSHGADGVGTFTSEGGDEAARVATGKDVMGVKAVNTLDIPGLQTPGTVVVDYLGRRLVAQSIVPGIFRQREDGASQIDYGGVEGKDTVATNEGFAPIFETMSKAMRVKKHSVWDKDGKKHDLVASVETKGLLGTDGRKYVLDLYRITPLDIDFINKHWNGLEDETAYPHRMGVLRPELVDAFWKLKMREYVSKEVETRRKAREEKAAAAKAEEGEGKEGEDAGKKEETQDDRIDISGFNFALNPDVFTGQVPQTDEEKAMYAADEKDVRDACAFLNEKVIPGLIEDLKEGDVGSPMDGHSLTRLMHKRGINVRYLGTIANKAIEQGSKLASIRTLAVQEMISRAAKHILNNLLRGLPGPLIAHCISHFLNCMLGYSHNKEPKVTQDEGLWGLYHDADFSFEKLTVDGLRAQLKVEVFKRFRYTIQKGDEIKKLQLLREIALKLGLQMKCRAYDFDEPKADAAKVNGDTPVSNGTGKKNKRKGANTTNSGSTSPQNVAPSHSFTPDDILNIVPIVKDSSSKSQLAEEALEAGRISIMQDQKELGQELLLESLSLHEQIYGVLHPEVSRVYNTLSMLYYQLEEKAAAVELARKAVIISERTVGIDSTETILNYLNLGLFEHANGDTRAALSYIKHAFTFWRIIFGDGHPDSVTTMNNTAVMLQALKHYHDSRLWFEASLEVCENIFGKNSANAATLSFQLAQALALDNDSKGAVSRMRDAHNIFLTELGPDDRNTKEASTWLDQLTQNAVTIAKQAKDVQARRHQRYKMVPRVTMSTVPQPQAESSTSVASTGAMDSRSIDDLMKFIEGAEAKAPKRTVKTTNPKRRGGSSKK